ncbi:unnamed protein product, partial [marine sediment metagenome]
PICLWGNNVFTASIEGIKSLSPEMIYALSNL